MRPRFIWAFARFNGISWIKSSPWSIVANVVSPLSLLLIITFLSAGKLVSYAVVGGTIAIVASTTLTATGQSALFRLEFKIQDLLVSTRISMIDYMLAFALADIVFASPGLTFFIIMSLFLHLLTPLRLLATIVVVVLLALATTSIAILAGSRIKRTIGMWAISGIISSVFTLIPPTFYPYTVLPKPLLYLFAISPITSAAVTLQGVYGLGPVDSIMFPLLIAEAAFYILMVRLLGRWREK